METGQIECEGCQCGAIATQKVLDIFDHLKPRYLCEECAEWVRNCNWEMTGTKPKPVYLTPPPSETPTAG